MAMSPHPQLSFQEVWPLRAPLQLKSGCCHRTRHQESEVLWRLLKSVLLLLKLITICYHSQSPKTPADENWWKRKTAFPLSFTFRWESVSHWPEPNSKLGQRNWGHIVCRLSTLTTQSESEVKSLSCLRLFANPWTPSSSIHSRQEYWSGLPFPSPGNLPDPGIEPRSPAL